MKCINCGKENKDNTNFCSNCGVKLEQQIQKESAQNGNINIKQIQNTNNKKIPTLSWIALGFLCMQLLCFLCQYVEFLYKYVYSKVLFLFEFPYIIVSLILAIISRVINKDKMSLALIIVDAIIIVIVICLLAIFAIALGRIFSSCFTPGSEEWNFINEIVEGIRRATE